MIKEKKFFLLSVLIGFLLFIIPHIPVKAANEELLHLYDNAKLLKSDETNTIEKKLKKLSNQYSCDILIITTENIDGYTNRDHYNIDFANRHQINNNYIILLVNMDTQNNGNNRGMTISVNGKYSKRIKNKLCTKICKSIRTDMTNEQYYDAFSSFITQTSHYVSGSYWFYILATPASLAISFGISCVIGIIVVGIMVYNKEEKDTTNAKTYLNSSSSRVLIKRDQYIRTTVTKTKKQSNNNSDSSSGGGGGHSSGGCDF